MLFALLYSPCCANYPRSIRVSTEMLAFVKTTQNVRNSRAYEDVCITSNDNYILRSVQTDLKEGATN
jgi:hypothetical protein